MTGAEIGLLITTFLKALPKLVDLGQDFLDTQKKNEKDKEIAVVNADQQKFNSLTAQLEDLRAKHTVIEKRVAMLMAMKIGGANV